jgi:hypothetical protein
LTRIGEREHRVANVVNPAKWQMNLDAIHGDPAAAVGIDRPSRRPHVTGVESSSHDATCALTGGVYDVGLRRWDDRHLDAIRRRQFLTHHAGEIAQPLEVLLGDRGHDGDVRLDDGAQPWDLAGLVGAHLHDRDIGVVRRRE